MATSPFQIDATNLSHVAKTNRNYDSLTYDITCVTPLLMHGGEKDKGSGDAIPEIRTASFNGVLRYWSRILRIMPLKEHAQYFENPLFGTATANDSFKGLAQLSLTEKAGKGTEKFQLSKSRPNARARGFNAGTELHLSVKLRHSHKSQEAYDKLKEINIKSENLFKDNTYLTYLTWLIYLTVNLGGFGQRGRHGYGSLQMDFPSKIKGYNYDSFENLVQCFNFVFNILGLKVKAEEDYFYNKTPGIDDSDEPFWSEAYFFKSSKTEVGSILNDIRQATHEAEYHYPGAIGSAKPRVPSPLTTGLLKLNNDSFVVTVIEVYDYSTKYDDNYNDAKDFLY